MKPNFLLHGYSVTRVASNNNHTQPCPRDFSVSAKSVYFLNEMRLVNGRRRRDRKRVNYLVKRIIMIDAMFFFFFFLSQAQVQPWLFVCFHFKFDMYSLNFFG